jgi:DNA excision repair protein ERCC-2
MDLFAYDEPRPGQRELWDRAREAFDEGYPLMVEAPTGAGKTAAVVSAGLAATRGTDRTVLYLTRTNSQQRPVADEVQRIRDETDATVAALPLQGRSHLCTLAKRREAFARAGPEQLADLCRDARRAAEAPEPPADGPAPCEPAARTTPEAVDEAADWIHDHPPRAEDLVDAAEDQGLCPYLVTRGLLPEADLVVAPYVYLFQPFLREALLGWMETDVPDLSVVVDEAHNLPSHLRTVGTEHLSTRSLERAEAEARDRQASLPDGDPLHEAVAGLRQGIAELVDAAVPDDREDALLDPDDVLAHVLPHLGGTSRDLDTLVETMAQAGEALREERRAAGETPRSSLATASAFLRTWRRAEPPTHARVAVAADAPTLELTLLDPSDLARPLREAAGAVLMSGTLTPHSATRDPLGLAGATTATLPDPTPDGNQLLLYDPTVTTRYETVERDPAMWEAIADRIRTVRAAVPANAAVFFPSHRVLARVTDHLDDPDALVDGPDTGQAALMDLVDRFRRSQGATLYSVLGGRVAEGLDFPRDTLELVIVAGLPYPRPTARRKALQRFHEVRFGRGWADAVRAPMTRRVRQAVGRLLRGPDERGAAVILDARAETLETALPGLRPADDPAAAVRTFLAERTGAEGTEAAERKSQGFKL